MNMLLSLSTDIWLAILGDWVGDIRDLTRLDSSCARSVRYSFLSLLRDPRCLLSCQLKVSSKTDMIGCVQWTNSRLVRLRSVCVVNMAVLGACSKISYCCLEKLTVLEVHYVDLHSAVISDEFQTLVKLCPALSALDMRNCMIGGDTYPALPLRTLSTYSTGHNEAYLLLPAHRAFCSTLECLIVDRDGVLSESQVAELVQCRKLKELTMSADLTDTAVRRYLASSEHFPCLEVFHFRNKKAVVTDSMLVDGYWQSAPRADLTHMRV